VLEEILKRAGIYMVYDKCKFRFGRWSQRPPTPTVVNDTALAEPKVTLTFDRNNCVQTALMKICWNLQGDSPTTQSVPVNNVDLGIGALGKVVTLSHWTPLGSIEYLPNSQMFANAVNTVTRFSQAAAMVEVVYRDDVFDLVVGQQVAFSSDYVPNADGGMGVTLATGFVLKAARSWQTPTTAYTIALPGYLTSRSRQHGQARGRRAATCRPSNCRCSCRAGRSPLCCAISTARCRGRATTCRRSTSARTNC
jgi:hypothetical protein